MTLRNFKGGDPGTRENLNVIVELARKIENFSGDGLILVTHSTNGVQISIDRDALQSLIPKYRAPASGIRRAFCKEDAPFGTVIDCYLDIDDTGEEIEVTITITGGSHLKYAAPLLVDGLLIWVVYDTVDEKWRNVGNPYESTVVC